MALWKCFKEVFTVDLRENSAEAFCACLIFAEQSTLLGTSIADEWEGMLVGTWGGH